MRDETNDHRSPMTERGVQAPAALARLVLADRLAAAGLSRSNPRSQRAMRALKDGQSVDDCLVDAVKHESDARAMWVEAAFDPWRQRHGLSLEQALSVAFGDDSFNLANPSREIPTVNGLDAWPGQQHDFAAALRRQVEAEKAQRPNRAVAMASAYPPRAGEAVDLAGPLYDSEGFAHRLVSLSSREAVTCLPGGFHALFDRATFKCLQHLDLSLRNTPLSEEERQAQEAASLLALRGPVPTEPAGPPDLVAWLRRLDEWMTLGHFDGFAIDAKGECARLREDLQRATDADPELHAYLTACAGFFEVENPREGGAALTRGVQSSVARGLRARLEALDALTIDQTASQDDDAGDQPRA